MVLTPKHDKTDETGSPASETGDGADLRELFQVVYGELHILAGRQRARWLGDPTMGTTALVHEAYLKLADQSQPPAASRAHFFALAARVMRQVLSDYARTRRRHKRGGDAQKLSLDELVALGGVHEALAAPERADVLAALDDALVRLEARNERQCRVVECRFYGGMSVTETAEALDTSPATVKRDWTLAQAWLYRELSE